MPKEMGRGSTFAVSIAGKSFCRHPPVSSRRKSPEAVVDNNMRTTLTTARLNPIRLGLGFGTTGVVFYLGCMFTMAIVPHEKAVVFFNSLLHGFNIEPILRTGVPANEVALGLIITFVLGCLAGLTIAAFYNLGLRKS